MNEEQAQKVMQGLSDAANSIDEPAFILLCHGEDGNTFISINDVADEMDGREKSCMFTGSVLSLVSAVLDPSHE